MEEQRSEDKGKSPGLMLAQNITILEGLFLGFQLSQCQGWEETWGAPRQGGSGWGRCHLCGGDQRPEVSGRGQEPSALSLQKANKSLCILLPSFPFQPIFQLLINVDSALLAAPDNSGMFI